MKNRIKEEIDEIRSLEDKARKCMEANVKQAIAVSFVPLVSVPIICGICAKMVVRLDKIFGIPTEKGFESEIVSDLLVGIIAAPLMAVPLLGAGMASVYIRAVGENYIQAVMNVLNTSEPHELKDAEFVTRRIKEESQKIQNEKRKKRMERSKADSLPLPDFAY